MLRDWIKVILLCMVFLMGLMIIGVLLFPGRASSQGSGMYVLQDSETGCEYLRTSTSGTPVPRMEGFGAEYRHRGCRRLIERTSN